MTELPETMPCPQCVGGDQRRGVTARVRNTVSAAYRCPCGFGHVAVLPAEDARPGEALAAGNLIQNAIARQDTRLEAAR